MRQQLLAIALIGMLSPYCHGALLSDLLAGGEITAGNLRFSQFSYVAHSELPTASQVTVTPVVDATDHAGLRFDWSINFTTGQSDRRATLTYVVETLQQGRHLASAGMTGDPTGTGILSVKQRFQDLAPLFNFIYARSGSIDHSDELSPYFFGLFGRFSRHQVISELSGGGVGAMSFFEQTFATPAPSADFNDDGTVDGNDFLIWQRRLGFYTGQDADGDANVDGRIDADDLAVWKSQYGAGSQVAAVPEPGAPLLAAIGGCLVAFSGRLRRLCV